MAGWIVAVFIVLILSLGGLLVLAALLWWLLSRHPKETAETAIELGAGAPAPEGEWSDAEGEAGAPDLEAEWASREIEEMAQAVDHEPLPMEGELLHPGADAEEPAAGLSLPKVEGEVQDLASEAPAAEVRLGSRAPFGVAQAELKAAPSAADDLTLVEGIGPRISSVLQAAGITAFTQLAATAVSQLEQILEQADPRLRRLADPTTWGEQASLAAAGDWDALKALQGALKGGRRRA